MSILKSIVISCAILLTTSSCRAINEMPRQKAPEAFVSVKRPSSYGERVLVQGLAGLAAQAVNENRGDELVCINLRDKPYPEWKKQTIQRLKIENRGEFTVWELLTHYVGNGTVKGYVLYSSDLKNTKATQDESVNVATSMAGILQAVPIEESMEDRAVEAGLKKLYDARGVSMQKCFRRYKNRFSRNLLCLINPKKEFVRDMAIAQKSFVAFGNNDFTWSVVDWLNPLAPILGWNEGDESAHTLPITRHAHYNTASDWAKNLTFLSAGANETVLAKNRLLNPEEIDWSDTRPCVTFMMSDGDNTGWLMGNFWNKIYYGNAKRGHFPMGWSACIGTLSSLAPAVWQRLAEEQSPHDSLVEFTGGYFYPDRFGETLSSAKREQLLRKHARSLGRIMEKTNVRLLCLIAWKSDSPEAMEAYRIFAEEIPDLLGIMVMDYVPYHRMKGTVFWVKDQNDQDVPVITARYAMWAGMRRPLAGGPAEVATAILQDAEQNRPPGWVAVHAWSKHTVSSSEKEVQGLDAVASCIEQLDDKKVRVISPEEMMWRLRREHNGDEMNALRDKLFGIEQFTLCEKDE